MIKNSEFNNDFWINEIPKDWNIIRFKYSIEKLESGNRSKDSNLLESGVYSVGGEHIQNGKLYLDNPHFISEEFYDQILNTGKINSNSILLVKDGATIGKMCYIKKMPYSKMAVNEHVFKILSRKEFYSKYIYYILISYYGQEQIKLNIKGSAQPGLNSSFINYFSILYPNAVKQEKIANYLDEKSEIIDDIISSKKKLIKLLEEQKQALVHEAVTKGLNENQKLKDRKIDWIGEIPTDWNIYKIKNIGRFSTSSINKKIDPQEQKIYLVNYMDIYKNKHNHTLINGEYMIVSANDNQIQSSDLKKGDILFTPSSETIQDIGLSAVVLEDLKNTFFSYHILRLRFYKDINLKFKKYLFNNYFVYNQFSSLACGTTRMTLKLNKFKNTFVILPNEEEQEYIANYLDKNIVDLDHKINKYKKQITLYKEYKEALIFEAVTGKIKI